MKAYELKIALRGQSPEVWRRVLVPEELTFSQLALVFNLAMGWEKETVFSFLLPHKKMVVTELSEEQAHGERLKEAAGANLQPSGTCGRLSLPLREPARDAPRRVSGKDCRAVER